MIERKGGKERNQEREMRRWQERERKRALQRERERFFAGRVS